MAAGSPDERRIAAIIVLLGAALVLAAVLTFQAVSSVAGRRNAARRTVRDFAAIATDELLRRAAADVEGYGFAPVRAAVATRLGHGEPMPSLDAIRREDDIRLAQGLSLVGQLFIVDFNQRTVTPPLPKPLEIWMLTNLLQTARQRRRSGEPQAIRVQADGVDSLIAYGIVQMDAGRIFGMTVDDAALAPFVQRAFARRSIFPPSAANGQVSNRDIFVSVAMHGRVLFRSSGSFNPELGITKTAGADAGEVFRGAAIEASIAGSAVPRLVAGGLPEVRLALHAAVLATTIGLVVAAAYLLRRERQLIRMRSDFVSGVSHELRTPLTQIRMFAETLLLDRVRSPQEGKRSLEIIDQEARRLAHLVENVLLFSRGERGNLEVFASERDVSEVIGQTVEQFTPIAASRNVEITMDVPVPLVARLDADAWKQVLLNLLENAVRYGPEGQTVRVAASSADGVFRMSVEDEGPGVPEMEREAIWGKFIRLERDRGTHKAGTGIGLAVVREIVALHGGRCWVEDAPQRGSRFVVEIPR